MKAAVLRETFPGEKRVALVAGNLAQLQKAGIDVIVESGAGQSAGITDADYEAKGATIATDRQAAFDADLVLQVRSLGANPENGAADLPLMKTGQLIVGTCDPLGSATAAATLAATGATSFSLELIPRITRAQSMDVLSSQATIAGYRAVLLAANELPKIFPLLMTAAGTLTAARVFVIGAGVAGLQAIATARRLGGIVEAYDVRPACREQVESLGAKFVELQLEATESEDQGGYAKALGEDFYQKQRELMAAVVSESDVVITTAAIPGQTSPLLITAEAVEGMASGGVIIDLAAERGGNCELSVADQRIVKNGVVILGPTNLPAEIPNHASQMFSNNVTNFLLNLVKDGEINLDLDDEIIAGTMVTHEGQVSNARIRELLGLEALNETPEQNPEATGQTFNATQDQNMEPTSNEIADSINDEEPSV
ncbi:MAG: Re/Si-specific NAD(P)(+) transhydrogenase subunit alpha [Pirellulaceae bacterium]|nr:Re/Si-specific NAD(P)(+) transhydrogenase subunit alpha [Pirellulaceae bacterium]